MWGKANPMCSNRGFPELSKTRRSSGTSTPPPSWFYSRGPSHGFCTRWAYQHSIHRPSELWYQLTYRWWCASAGQMNRWVPFQNPRWLQPWPVGEICTWSLHLACSCTRCSAFGNRSILHISGKLTPDRLRISGRSLSTACRCAPANPLLFLCFLSCL